MPKKYNPYILFTIAFLSVTFGAMNSVLSSAYLPEILADLDIVHTEAGQATAGAWINFAFLAGGTIGGILLSFLSDRVGRRKTLIFSILFFSISSGLGAFLNNWLIFSISRFMVGVGVGTALVTSAVMLSEDWNPKFKAVALGILAVAYPAGIIASGLITSMITNWRAAFFIGAIPILLIIPAFYFISETRSKLPFNTSSQKSTLNRYRGSLISGILIYGTMLIGLWSAFSWMPTWVQSLHGENTTSSLVERGMAVTLLGLGGMIGSIVSGWLANLWGSRLVQGVCFVICLLLSFLLFKLSTSYSSLILAGSGILGLCFGVSQGVLNNFIPSMFPTSIRATATGLCFHTGRAFTAIAVFFVGAWALSLGGYGNAIFIFSGVYLLGLLALLFMKNTEKTRMAEIPNDSG